MDVVIAITAKATRALIHHWEAAFFSSADSPSSSFGARISEGIRAKGLKIPRDIALMTFDNYPFSMIVQPTLTAIEVDMYEMGWQAARFMLQMIKKPNLQTQSFCTTPAIIEREST